MRRTAMLTGVLASLFSVQAGAVDINCMFPNADMSCTHYQSWSDDSYYSKPAPSTWSRVGETEDGFIIEMKPAKAWTGPTKNVVSPSCNFAPNAPAVFGVCPELGESVGVSYRVRQPVYSHSYPLGAVNNKRSPSIDDWRDAFSD